MDSPPFPSADMFESVNAVAALDALDKKALPTILTSQNTLEKPTAPISGLEATPSSPFPPISTKTRPQNANYDHHGVLAESWEFIQHLLDQTQAPERKIDKANGDGHNGSTDDSKTSVQSIDDTFAPSRAQLDALISLVLFLERSNGMFRDHVIPHLLKWVHILPRMRPSDIWMDYIPLEAFSYLFVIRLLRLGEVFPECASQVWKSVTDTYFVIVGDVSDKLPDRVRSSTLPVWRGVTRAMTEAPCSNHLEIVEPLLGIARTTVTDASVRAVRTAFAQGVPSVAERLRWGSGPYVLDRRVETTSWMHQRSQSAYVLGAFTMIRNIATGLCKGTLQMTFDSGAGSQPDYDLWTLIVPSVLKKAPLRCVGDTEKNSVRELFDIALKWALELRHQIRASQQPDMQEPSSAQSLETKCSALSVVLQVAIVCVLLTNEVKEDLLTRLNQFLGDDAFLTVSGGLLLYTTSMEALGVTAVTFPKTTKAIVDLLREYLASPSVVLLKASPEARQIIRNCAVRTVSRILICTGNKEFTKATLYSFLHLLYSIDSTTPNGTFTEAQRVVYENFLAAITDIACLSGTKEVVEISTSALIRRIDPSVVQPDLFVFDRLADIFISTDSVEVATSITNLMSQLGKRSDVGSAQSVELVLNRLLGHLKRGDRPAAIHRMITRQVVQMFVDKAMWARFGVDDQINKPAQERELLRLVHVIRGFLESPSYDPAEFDHTTETVYLFRNFWIYCVIIGLDSRANWKEGWREPLVDIARKSPALVIKETTVPLETDLDSNSPLRQKLTDAFTTKARSALIQCVPAKAGEQRPLSSKVVIYMLTVYQLETLRCIKGSIKHLLRYLSAVGTFSDQVWPFLESTVYQVVERYIYIRQQVPTSQYEILERDLTPFVIAAGNRIPRCRLAARTCVEKVIAAFPFMLWNRTLMTTLLHILFSLAGEFPVNPADRNVQDPTLVDLQKYLSIPDRRDHRQEVINAYMDFGQRWLALSMKVSASECTGILQNYILRLQLLESKDVALIAPSTTSKVLRLLGPDVFAAVWSRGMFPEQLRYLGEVLAQIPSLADPGQAADTDHAWLNMADELKRDFKELAPPHVSNITARDENKFAAALASLMQRSVGFFSISKKFDKDLLRFLCWTPMKVFTEKILGLATSCWSLLVTARPDLEGHVIAELAEAWEWTRQVGLGIFSTKHHRIDPMTKNMSFVPTQKGCDDDTIDFTIPHLLWTEFFLDRYEVARFRRADHGKIYQKIAQTTLEDSSKLCTVRGCRTVLFKILALVAKFFTELPYNQGTARWALLMYLYSGFVPWFSQAPVWVGTMDAKLQRGEMEAMLQFYASVKSQSVAHPVSSDNFGNPISLNADFTHPIIREALDKRLYRFGAWKPDGISYRIPPESGLDLLQILTENEIQHLWAWLNPLGETHSALGDLAIPSGHVIAPNKWKDVVDTAWAIRPALALQLLHRFPKDVHRATLSSLVSQNPAACLEVPSALWILTQDRKNLEKYSLHMRFLMLWQPVPPMSAISIATSISPPNPWLTQYFMRTLEHYPPEDVFFYVPQLVQALRHDAVGYVERYIVETAQASQLFAHQIIWNMNANMYKDDDAKVVRVYA
jgi:phosphatidylinositol 4-kinase